jgi:hypothetical protein
MTLHRDDAFGVLVRKGSTVISVVEIFIALCSERWVFWFNFIPVGVKKVGPEKKRVF